MGRHLAEPESSVALALARLPTSLAARTPHLPSKSGALEWPQTAVVIDRSQQRNLHPIVDPCRSELPSSWPWLAIVADAVVVVVVPLTFDDIARVAVTRYECYDYATTLVTWAFGSGGSYVPTPVCVKSRPLNWSVLGA